MNQGCFIESVFSYAVSLGLQAFFGVPGTGSSNWPTYARIVRLSLMSSSAILCFGEVLWDCLPKGLFPGGAPINVAYHLRRYGLNAIPITAVGRDFLGDEILRRFRYWELSPEFVGQIDRPTGAVVVDLDGAGVARYRFLEDVAWDHIPLSDGVNAVAESATALVFGTLAQRSEANCSQLSELRGRASKSQHVYDVNLRPPYDDPNLVWDLARGCHLIKLNDEELLKLLQMKEAPDALQRGAALFSERTGCPRVCVTAGKKGAGLWWEGQWTWDPPEPIEVKDTVGAGDSFLASLLHGWLVGGLSPAENLHRSARVAEFVATCDGATPAYRPDERGLPVLLAP